MAGSWRPTLKPSRNPTSWWSRPTTPRSSSSSVELPGRRPSQRAGRDDGQVPRARKPVVIVSMAASAAATYPGHGVCCSSQPDQRGGVARSVACRRRAFAGTDKLPPDASGRTGEPWRLHRASANGVLAQLMALMRLVKDPGRPEAQRFVQHQAEIPGIVRETSPGTTPTPLKAAAATAGLADPP